MSKKYKDTRNDMKLHFLILGCIVLATFFLGIGYAAINSIQLEVEGKTTAMAHEGIFITDVQYSKNTNADTTNSIIKQFYQAMMESSIHLSSTDVNSSITYNISIYNSTNEEYEFKGVVYGEEFYDNPNITFELEGLKVKDRIKGKQTINFSITFKYSGEITNSALNSLLKFEFGEPTKVRIPGIKYEQDTTVTIAGKTVDIPAGMTLSYLPSEYENVDEGIVIYRIPEYSKEEVDSWEQEKWITDKETMQEAYDQFVWVPIETPVLDLSSTTLTNDNVKAAVQEQINNNKYPMAIKKPDGHYSGVLYQFTGNTSGVTIEPLSTWTPVLSSTASGSSDGNNEPSGISTGDVTNLITPYLKNRVNAILGTNYQNATDFGQGLQNQFDDMMGRVIKHGGFWMARYETSGMTGDTAKIKVGAVKGKMGRTASLGSDLKDGVTFINWHQMYSYQNCYAEMAGLSTMSSNMIWGSQWDQIMIWMKDIPNTTSYAGDNPWYIVNSKGMGNYETSNGGTGELQRTGYYAQKNIFDLSGNVLDWTLESNKATIREARGGGYDGTDSQPYAAYRSTNGRGAVGLRVGTRFTIY